jgi:hypothetical protein
LIRHGVASTIFRVTVQRQPPPDEGLARSLAAGIATLAGGDGNGSGAARPALAGAGAAARVGGTTMAAGGAVRNVRASLGDQPLTQDSGNGSGAPGGARPGYTPTGQRIGRNDSCWCGSGAKYKKCHGR